MDPPPPQGRRVGYRLKRMILQATRTTEGNCDLGHVRSYLLNRRIATLMISLQTCGSHHPSALKLFAAIVPSSRSLLLFTKTAAEERAFAVFSFAEPSAAPDFSDRRCRWLFICWNKQQKQPDCPASSTTVR